MTALVKGVYGEARGAVSGLPFGIYSGQTHKRHARIQNGGWYNRCGERLGWGDLSTKEMLRIAKELKHGECFIILTEGDGKLCLTDEALDASAPGITHITTRATHVIAPDHVYLICEWPPSQKNPQALSDKGFFILDRESARRLILHGKFL